MDRRWFFVLKRSVDYCVSHMALRSEARTHAQPGRWTEQWPAREAEIYDTDEQYGSEGDRGVRVEAGRRAAARLRKRRRSLA